MIDVVKKTMLTGLGFAILSKERIDQTVKEMVERGSISENEGRKLVDEMMSQADKARNDVEKMVNSYMNKALERMDLAKKSDVEELRRAIEDLKLRLDMEKGDTLGKTE